MSLFTITQAKKCTGLLLPASLYASCMLALLWLTGCASTDIPAPVDTRERVAHRVQKGAATHRVTKGDTLFSIAWRYGLDYHRLADWNRIGSSYHIYPGQVLRLSAASQPTGSVKTRTPAVTKAAPARKPTVNESPAPRKKPPTTTKPPAQASRPASAEVSSGALKWVWPTRGTVVQTFHQGDHTRQGIRIAGKFGQPIVAAESGKVVYTGSGLPGYGKLIIVKHNKNYLSAYGFNEKLLVKDGDQVAKGGRIAEMGRSTDGKALLHFEIRSRDKPLDPLKRLPR